MCSQEQSSEMLHPEGDSIVDGINSFFSEKGRSAEGLEISRVVARLTQRVNRYIPENRTEALRFDVASAVLARILSPEPISQSYARGAVFRLLKSREQVLHNKALFQSRHYWILYYVVNGFSNEWFEDPFNLGFFMGTGVVPGIFHDVSLQIVSRNMEWILKSPGGSNFAILQPIHQDIINLIQPYCVTDDIVSMAFVLSAMNGDVPAVESMLYRVDRYAIEEAISAAVIAGGSTPTSFDVINAILTVDNNVDELVAYVMAVARNDFESMQETYQNKYSTAGVGVAVALGNLDTITYALELGSSFDIQQRPSQLAYAIDVSIARKNMPAFLHLQKFGNELTGGLAFVSSDTFEVAVNVDNVEAMNYIAEHVRLPFTCPRALFVSASRRMMDIATRAFILT